MVLGGNHPDVIVIMPDDKHKIGIDQIHELQHKLQYEQYATASQRVAIIARAERLTLPAQNALLKTLEEPPAGTTILLTATTPTALLPTVISRCRLLYLPPVADKVIRAFIEEAYPTADASVISVLSHGAPGRAVSYATDPGQVAADQVVVQEVESLLQTAGLFERLQAAARMVTAADQRDRYIAELIIQTRAQARLVANPAVLDAVERLQQRLRANVSPKTAFEALAVELG
jgi:DNA polymerase-3 subunit delta'